MLMDMHPKQQAFNLLYKELDDLYRETAVAMGLSDSAQMVLYTLCELGDGCLQKDICARCYLTKQTVHSSVRKLEREGIVMRSPGKGRDMHLSLTEAGQALVKQTILPLTEAEYRTMETLSPAEQAELLRLTQKYVAALRHQVKQLTAK